MGGQAELASSPRSDHHLRSLMPDSKKENFSEGALLGKLFQDLGRQGKNNFLFEPEFRYLYRN
jgi:hypothetical protein